MLALAGLTCLIHESLGFVNKHPQQIENLCCGFRQGASRPLKVSPERRPVKAGVEVPRQARDHELAEWPGGRIIHESEVSS